MNKGEKISVILPVYNAEKTLKYTIDSVLTQKGNFELICVNDASTDDSLEILKSYNCYSNFKIIDLEKNAGVSHARNIGLREATGDLIMFIDADDTFPSNIFSDLDRLPLDSDLIIFNYKVVSKLNKTFPEQFTSKGVRVSTEDCQNAVVGLKTNSKLNTRMTSVWGKVFQKNIIEANNIYFDENLSIGEDSIFLYEYYEYSKVIMYYDVIGYNYYINPASVTHTFQPKMIENDRNWQYAFEKLLEKLPHNQLADEYKKYSIAKGILNICYLNLSYKYSKYDFSKVLGSIVKLFKQSPYSTYEFDNLDLFYKKDKLILFLLKNKFYKIAALILYLNR